MKNRIDERNLKNNCFLLREGFGKNVWFSLKQPKISDKPTCPDVLSKYYNWWYGHIGAFLYTSKCYLR